MTLNRLYSSLASISLPVQWQQQNNFPRRPPGLKEVMYEKAPCSNARHSLGTKRKLILVFWKCCLERMPLKTSAMWKINSSTGISKQRKPDDGSRLTLAQVKPPVPTQRVRGLYRVPSSGRRAGHGAPSNWENKGEQGKMTGWKPSPLPSITISPRAREPTVTPSVRFTSKREIKKGAFTHSQLFITPRKNINNMPRTPLKILKIAAGADRWKIMEMQKIMETYSLPIQSKISGAVESGCWVSRHVLRCAVINLFMETSFVNGSLRCCILNSIIKTSQSGC